MEDLIKSVAKNANVGIDAIDDIKCSIKDEELKNVVLNQRAKLCDLKDRAIAEIKGDKDNVCTCCFGKAMLKSAVVMKTAFDKSNKNIAQMLIEGNNMGINSVIEASHEKGAEETPLVGELLELYDANIKELRQYL